MAKGALGLVASAEVGQWPEIDPTRLKCSGFRVEGSGVEFVPSVVREAHNISSDPASTIPEAA